MNLLKYVTLIVFSVVLFTSCGQVNRGFAQLTGVSKMCVDNVLYLQFSSGVTVAYEADGSIKTCK